MKNKINEGDKVDVYFSRADTIFNAEVLHIPVETGDCWQLKTITQKLVSGLHVGEKVVIENIDHIHYVQMFERMDKI